MKALYYLMCYILYIIKFNKISQQKKVVQFQLDFKSSNVKCNDKR